MYRYNDTALELLQVQITDLKGKLYEQKCNGDSEFMQTMNLALIGTSTILLISLISVYLYFRGQLNALMQVEVEPIQTSKKKEDDTMVS